MKIKTPNYRFRFCLLLVFVVMTTVSIPAFAQRDDTGLSTTGQAELSVAPNVAYATVTFTIYNKEQRAAMSWVKREMKRFLKRVEKHNPDHIAVSSIKTQPSSGQFVVTQAVVVRVEDFSTLPQITEIVNESSIRVAIAYSHTELDRLKRQVTKTAAMNARNTAFELAGVTGMKLAGLKKMNSPEVTVHVPPTYYFEPGTPGEQPFGFGLIVLKHRINATFHVVKTRRVAAN